MEKLQLIYSQTYNFVYLRAKAILKREEDVQQLMKEVYVKAISEGVEESNPYEWLGKQVYTMGCSKFRRKKVREAGMIELNTQKYTAKKSVDREETSRLICEILENLPDMYHATLYAFYYDHMSLKDVSDVMGYNVKTMINRLNYAHKYLERALEEYQNEHKVNVQFSVEMLCEALRDWSAQNRLSGAVAQSVYTAVCRELGNSADNTEIGEQLAGSNRRIVEVEADEIAHISEELGIYSVDRLASAKKMIRSALRMFAAVAVVVITVALFKLAYEWVGNELKQSQKTEAQSEQSVDKKEDAAVPESESEPAPQPEVVEPVEDAQPMDSSYLLPNSDKEKVTRDDLSGLTKEQLRLARNEIYARHGVVFGTKDLDDYFATKSWYKPVMSLSQFYDTVELSMEEEANIILIQTVENER